MTFIPENHSKIPYKTNSVNAFNPGRKMSQWKFTFPELMLL